MGVGTFGFFDALFREITFALRDLQSRTENGREKIKQIKTTAKLIYINNAPRLPKLGKIHEHLTTQSSKSPKKNSLNYITVKL